MLGLIKSRLPKKGDPPSRRGFARDLAAVFYALENAEAVGGHWELTSFGALRLVIERGGSGAQNILLLLPDGLTSPTHVLAKKVDGDTTTYGWVETVTHASQHGES